MSRESESSASFLSTLLVSMHRPCQRSLLPSSIMSAVPPSWCYEASIGQRLALDAACKKRKGPEPTPPGNTPDQSRPDYFVNILANNGVELIIW
jgi:hypothetical protein